MFEDVVYFDNAAASRLDERVLEAMKPLFFDLYAVATSQFGYSLGVDARDALDGARGQIAALPGGNHFAYYWVVDLHCRAKISSMVVATRYIDLGVVSEDEHPAVV